MADVITRLQEFSDELTSGRIESIESYLAHDFFEHIPDDSEPSATERFSELASDLKAAMPDFSGTLVDLTSEADTTTGSLTISGTHRGQLWGAPATGNHISWTTPVSFRAIGDKFAIRFDDATLPELIGLLRQFGLVNPPDKMDQPLEHPVTPPEFLLKVVFTGKAGDKPCAHLDLIAVTEPDSDVCARCVGQGDSWPALRMCVICGYVGCCDTSKNRHMNAHFQETGHALMRSIRMEEGWMWCYEDEAFFETRVLDRYR